MFIKRENIITGNAIKMTGSGKDPFKKFSPHYTVTDNKRHKSVRSRSYVLSIRLRPNEMSSVSSCRSAISRSLKKSHSAE